MVEVKTISIPHYRLSLGKEEAEFITAVMGQAQDKTDLNIAQDIFDKFYDIGVTGEEFVVTNGAGGVLGAFVVNKRGNV